MAALIALISYLAIGLSISLALAYAAGRRDDNGYMGALPFMTFFWPIALPLWGLLSLLFWAFGAGQRKREGR